MTEVHAAFGAYREMIPLAHGDGFQLVRATSEDGERILALLPGSMERARLELSHARRIAGPAVVVPTPGRGPGAVALVELPGLEDSTPLAEGSELPPAALRHGLVVLLSALSQAHARGLLHGRVGSATILAGPSGEFHLIGWADAVDVEDESVDLSKTTASVSRDIEGVARALLPLLRAATRAHHASPDTAAMGVVEGVALVPEHGITRDFTRVLSRMLSQDPREVYAGAAEALEDLGEHDLSIGDGELPVDWPTAVDVTGIVRHVIREAVRDDDETQYEAVVEVVGPSGSGRTATLRRVASAIRDDGGLVLHISGSDPGPWGPFTTLTRRLLNLVSADAEPLREFDVEIATLLGEPCEAGDVAGVIGAVAAALGELLEVVFQRDLGVVLLDDAGQLGAASRQVWQSIVRWRHRRHIEGKGLPLAFVATSDGPAAPEMGLPTRVVELVPISRESLRQELCNVLWEPDLAPDLAEYLHAATEGWPRSLQACWADLVRDGVLQRNESRYHVHRSLDGAPAWSEAIVRALGQAYAEHGHQVRRFLEVLAAAGRRPLERRVCSTLSELSGPSLWRAAEAVEATDLVERVGTAWRLRSQSVRARVYSAIPLDRRRALHRELLAHYERLDQPDLNAQAEHARAGSHPRAADLTERAVRECLATGHLKEAVQHVRDLERHADSVGHRPDLWILAAEVLGSAGAVTEALRVTDRAMASNRLSVREELEVKLLCARLELTFDRPENVISIDVPYCPGAEEQICALRWFRAAALVTLGDLPRASREARLARAELDAPTKNPLVRFAEARYEAQRTRLLREWDANGWWSLQCVRRARRYGDPFLTVDQLVRYTIPLRITQQDRYFNILAHLQHIVRARRLQYTCLYPRFIAELYMKVPLKGPGTSNNNKLFRALECATSAAARAGGAHLEPYLRIRLASVHARQIGPPPSRIRKAALRFRDPSTWSPFAFSVAAYPALNAWWYYGYFDLIALLMRRADFAPDVPSTRRLRRMHRAMMFHAEPSPSVSPILQDLEALLAEDAAGTLPVHETSVVVMLLATLVRVSPAGACGGWTLERVLSWIDRGYDSWSREALALALMLWWPQMLDRALWDRLRAKSSIAAPPLPLAIEWQRLIVAGRHAMLIGDPVLAIAERTRARRELRLASTHDHAGVAAVARRYAGEFASELGRELVEERPRHSVVGMPVIDQWLSRILRALTTEGVRSWVRVRSPSLRARLRRYFAARDLLLVRDPLEIPARGVWTMYMPERWSDASSVRPSTVVISGVPLCHASSLLPEELMAGSRAAWVEICEPVVEVFEEGVMSLGDPAVSRELRRWGALYSWPGGVDEVRFVLQRLRQPVRYLPDARIACARYHRHYLVGTARQRRLGVLRALVGQSDGLAVSDLAIITGVSRRTLQREIRDMVRERMLQRHGAKSATRYLLAERSDAARSMLVR